MATKQYERIGRPTIIGLSVVVVAFMVLSLCVTATGTARFAVGMGYDATVGYGVGAIFDIAKSVLPVALIALLGRRAFGTAVVLGAAWMCLVAYSCLVPLRPPRSKLPSLPDASAGFVLHHAHNLHASGAHQYTAIRFIRSARGWRSGRGARSLLLARAAACA